MYDPAMECPKCHGSADLFAGSDDGAHYLCRGCGHAFVFDVKTLKTKAEAEVPDQGAEG